MEQEIRSLIAWMEREEAVTTLLGHLPETGEDTTTQVAIWERLRANLERREPYSLPALTIDPLADELVERGGAFRQRPDVTAALAGVDWTIGMVDLNSILSFQKTVVAEQAIQRVSSVGLNDLQVLFSVCLPEEGGPVTLGGQLDQDRKGIAFASSNPNLRVFGFRAQPIEGHMFFGFAMGFGTQFVQVAEYQGRWFVRDGYHRCFGLLGRGIQRIPCVFVRATTAAELGAEAAIFFRHELLFGPRPPFLGDFLREDVSVTCHRQATRKVIRISADEFQVAI